MKITFVGHASVLIESENVGLLIDPWLEGSAFNDSWALYPEPVLSTSHAKRVTHIWISHEHPDHLSIATIKSLPADIKSQIVVLFQRHYDTEVVDWLKRQGFKDVREMPHGKWLAISSGMTLACYQVGHLDSALAIKSEGRTVLNLNDCETPLVTLKRIKRQLGEVDVLLDQFSIAGWPGNSQDMERRRSAAANVLSNFMRDVEYIRPRYVIPFASFVRFAHRENAYINSVVNTPDDIAERVDPERLLVMYPGDDWTVGDDTKRQTEVALGRYRKDRSELAAQPLLFHDVYEADRILQAANQRIREFQSSYHQWILRKIPIVTFYLTDLDTVIRFDVNSTAEIVHLAESDCTVSLSSQAAWYSFAMRFGLSTLGVSGRYKINHSESSFAKLKKLGSAYSSGFYSKRAPRFGLKVRLFQFWWRRRYDIFPQFVQRLR
jgi:UDP-MurNAc hydroxylase